jgi:hypothetical protein
VNLDTVHAEYKLDSGNIIQIFEPDNSGQGPMKSGRCPGCHNGLEGFVGRCACVRELSNGDILQPVWGVYSTNYGHYDCIQALWFKIVKSLDEPETSPTVHVWRFGTQREMILCVQQAGLNNQHVVVSYDELAARDQRYKFRIEAKETNA